MPTYIHIYIHRIQGKDAEGKELPAGFREPMRFKPTELTEEFTRERRTGDVDIADCVYLDRKMAGDEEGKKKAVVYAMSLFKRCVYACVYVRVCVWVCVI
jgi:hypothetical protein